MSNRQNLRIGLEDFLLEYRSKIISILEANCTGDYYESCYGCGDEMHINPDVHSVDIAEAILDLVIDDLHSDIQLTRLTLTGDVAWNILNDKNKQTALPSQHKKFDDAMKGLT